MYKIISFSVWGNDPKYIKGSIENAIIAKEIYPGWICRFYCDSKVESSFVSNLENLGAEVVIMNTLKNNWEGLFWRFLPVSEKDVEIFISRDIDSRLNEREKSAVDEWIESDKMLHCMRDHIEHNVPILGGMWGCKKGLLKNIKKMINDWGRVDYKGSDQDFLRLYVWESYKDCAIVHDKFYKGFVIEERVNDIKEYYNNRNKQIEYRNQTFVAIEKYKSEAIMNGLKVPSDEEINSIFTVIPEPPPDKFDKDGNLVVDYIYNPINLFGKHDIRPFPFHKQIKYGTHVGEII